MIDPATALYAHVAGDYLLQNDWMADGKKHSSVICTVHVLAYLLPFLLAGASWWQLLAIGVQHWMQDRSTVVLEFMRRTGKRRFASPPLAPWSLIVTDNALHLVWVWFVVVYV